MGYGDNEARLNGIKKELPAVKSLSIFMKDFGYEVEHNSVQDTFGIDVKLKVGDRVVPLDVKTPSYVSENLSINYTKKNYGKNREVVAFIDGNILAKKEFDKKCVGLAPDSTPYRFPDKKNPSDSGFFLVRKTMTIYEFIDYIEKNIVCADALTFDWEF